ncbi:capsular biosynthesis protein [Caballeronia sp. LZ062]|uniref:capsular biosynthesis protein n=1 Tax=unclassified Caballeronia TaxID=2646786 RepID=UPI0028592329|nr:MULTISPECIES: capsular biosynthesis protein [unclassified Caballeronia]MDR5855197.1 capsular biosynthesis protein [Caballeronia sp. LZ050]MDR5870273.1 capsular biosynthesis protein [Caballeronia sp. LZ062]
MRKILLYDNTQPPPSDVSNLLGIERFSDVYYRKRSLERWMSDLADQAGFNFVDIETLAHPDSLIQPPLAGSGRQIIVYVPAWIAFGCAETEASLFLQKLGLTRNNLRVTSDSATFDPRAPYMMALVDDMAKALLHSIAAGESAESFLREVADQLQPVPDDARMIDLRDPLRFTDYLTSNFDARFFNSVQTVNDFVLLKRSTDGAKLRREHDFYHLLPPSMQMFFVQPYDFRQEAEGASYKMERLFVPDMALQWIHGSLDETHLERFLDKVLFFVRSRPTRSVPRDVAERARNEAYRSKLLARIEQLEALPAYAAIEPYARATFGGVRTLVARYFALLDRARPADIEKSLCIGHGDLCFSNILYSKTTGLMRFIDAKGAATEDELYVNPYYDIAKLSHSVVGNYDFINYGLFRLEVDADLKVRVLIDAAPKPWAAVAFRRKLVQNGFDPVLARLYEASLFISMAPLHIDVPKKVVAFLVNAAGILDEVEREF